MWNWTNLKSSFKPKQPKHMQKSFVYFNAIMFSLWLSFPPPWDYYSRLSRRGAESEETLESIGPVLFSAPNKSQKHLTVHVRVMMRIQMLSSIVQQRDSEIILNTPSVTWTVTSDIRYHPHHCETKSQRDTNNCRGGLCYHCLEKWITSVCFTLNNDDDSLLAASHSCAIRLSHCQGQ